MEGLVQKKSYQKTAAEKKISNLRQAIVDVVCEKLLLEKKRDEFLADKQKFDEENCKKMEVAKNFLEDAFTKKNATQVATHKKFMSLYNNYQDLSMKASNLSKLEDL